MDDPWTPKVLSEYEIGRCMSAIDAVAMLGKPIAEVMTRLGPLADLESDLAQCIKLSEKTDQVNFWVRPLGHKFRYGFYKEAWTLQALDFLDRTTTLNPYDRDWITGLLFGYRPDRIQEFLDKPKQL
jgi:hypothetical protein